MYQDIAPHVLDNQYHPVPPQPGDLVICYEKEKISVKYTDGQPCLPTVAEFEGAEPQYLFNIDGQNYYGIVNCQHLPKGVEYCGIRVAMAMEDKKLAYALMCALHLLRWYDDTRVCPRCGKPLLHKENERAIYCPDCGKTIYPTISPAVIVAVLNGHKVLLSQYAHGDHRHYALIAGFGEFGETIEETCHREVMEEVGLKIKDLHYYKSQPWALSSSLLFGFYCYLDGDDTITLDENELSAAKWVDVDDLDATVPTLNGSLTSEMIHNAKYYVK